MFEVTLIGGPLSGPAYRESYVPGRVYAYGAEDAEYVEMLSSKGRFVVTQIIKESAEPAPQAKPEPEAEPVAKPAKEKSAKKK